MLANMANGLFNRRTSNQVRFAVELGLITCVAWFAAGSVWRATGAIIDPAPPEYNRTARLSPSAALLETNLDLLTSYNPFVATNLSTAPNTIAAENIRETSLNLKLFGVRQSVSDPNRSSAILKLPNGSQRTFRVGQEIISGVTLDAVFADHIRLSRAGVTESLYLPGAKKQQNRTGVNSAPPGTGVSSSPSSQSELNIRLTQVEQLFSQLSLAPVREGRRISGWTILPASQANAVSRLGLKVGDQLTAINGKPISNAETLMELGETLTKSSHFQLSILRDGTAQNIKIGVSQ